MFLKAASTITALVLLIAGLMKARQLSTSPVAPDQWPQALWFWVLLVEYEIILGCWLLSGWRPRWANWTAVATFTTFLIVTMVRIAQGHDSCGCFGGGLEINPRIMLGLDAAIAGILCLAALKGTCPTSSSWRVLLSLGLVMPLLVGTSAWWMSRYSADMVMTEGDLSESEINLILEPDAWVGREFPLFSHIDVGDALRTGSWLIVLYQYDCDHCIETIPYLEAEGVRLEEATSGQGLAMIEIAPYANPGEEPIPADMDCLRGRLSDRRDWFVETPAIIEVDNGIVQRLRADLVP